MSAKDKKSCKSIKIKGDLWYAMGVGKSQKLTETLASDRKKLCIKKIDTINLNYLTSISQ